jgi:hypothetical protein
VRLITAAVAAAIVMSTSSTLSAAEMKYGGITIDADNINIGAKEYSPHLDRGFPERVFWGDTLNLN